MLRAKVLVLFALAVLALPTLAQVYQWVDENGKVHYSDTKPPEGKAKNVKVMDGAELESINTFESVDDGVDPDQLKRERERREDEREREKQQRLQQEAKNFQAKNCYTRTEDIRRGNVGGGTRVVGTQEVKRCRQPIPDNLKSYLPGYTYEGSE